MIVARLTFPDQRVEITVLLHGILVAVFTEVRAVTIALKSVKHKHCPVGSTSSRMIDSILFIIYSKKNKQVASRDKESDVTGDTAASAHARQLT